MSLFHFLYLNS